MMINEGDGGQVPIPALVFNDLRKIASGSTEKRTICINKQKLAIAV